MRRGKETYVSISAMLTPEQVAAMNGLQVQLEADEAMQAKQRMRQTCEDFLRKRGENHGGSRFDPLVYATLSVGLRQASSSGKDIPMPSDGNSPTAEILVMPMERSPKGVGIEVRVLPAANGSTLYSGEKFRIYPDGGAYVAPLIDHPRIRNITNGPTNATPRQLRSWGAIIDLLRKDLSASAA